jgi:DNA-directed RNA polymerase specialized sigma24 family protein
MKTKTSRFDRLIACYYPAVYSFASRFTDDPREAMALTRNAFNSARKRAEKLRKSDCDRVRPNFRSYTSGTRGGLI